MKRDDGGMLRGDGSRWGRSNMMVRMGSFWLVVEHFMIMRDRLRGG